MRFAGEPDEFKLPREEAREFVISDLARICPIDEIEGIAVCYSMGDNFSRITDIRKLKNPRPRQPRGCGQAYRGRDKSF